MLEAQQVNDESVLVHVDSFSLRSLSAAHERRQLVKRQRRVELQVRSDSGEHLLLMDFVHEDLGLVLYRLLGEIVLGVFTGRRRERQELGTGKVEAILELVHISHLHPVHLLVVILVPEHLLEALVDALGMQNQANGEQVVHLLRLLVDLIVLVAARGKQLLRALDVQQDSGEGPDGVRVTPHHHVSEADVIGGGDLAPWDVGVGALFVQLDAFQDFDGLVVVAQQGMQAQQPGEGEVTQHLVERVPAENASHGVGVSAARVNLQLALDLGLVHQEMQDVQDAENVPDFALLRIVELRDFVGGFFLVGASVLGEAGELVDEFVDQLPEPLVREFQLDRGFGLEDVVEEVAVIEERAEALFQGRGRGETSVDVAVVQFLVQG